MAYTTIDDPTAYFQTKVYTGNGANDRAITFDGNSNLQPDWLWIKNRSESQSHALFDSVRGATKRFGTNNTAAESTENTNLDSFDSNGFTVDNELIVNGSDDLMVAWAWKAGTSVSGNSSGSGSAKAYTGSVNTDAGFSIIRYVGNGTNGHTIPHHLGAAPRFLWTKRLDSATGGDGTVLHMGLSGGANDFIELNSTGAKQTNIARWRNTTPTSTVFTIASGTTLNGNDSPYIAYCFAEKKGYSKFDVFLGNENADGPYIHLGFKPAYFMYKNANYTGNWNIKDNKRSGTAALQNFGQMNPNQTENPTANTNNPENKASAFAVDFLANGVKFRGVDNAGSNWSNNYIYVAFAESPFVTSTGIPTTAR